MFIYLSIAFPVEMFFTICAPASTAVFGCSYCGSVGSRFLVFDLLISSLYSLNIAVPGYLYTSLDAVFWLGVVFHFVLIEGKHIISAHSTAMKRRSDAALCVNVLWYSCLTFELIKILLAAMFYHSMPNQLGRVQWSNTAVSVVQFSNTVN